MSKHWRQATKRQTQWADEHGVLVAPDDENKFIPCQGCVFFVDEQCKNPDAPSPCCKPSIIFKRKEKDNG